MSAVAFFLRHFSERGSEVSVYSYAHFNEALLGNRSIVVSLHPDLLRQHDLPCVEAIYRRFSERFEVVHVGEFGELAGVLEDLEADVFYTQTHGGPETAPYAAPDFAVKSVVHCVFSTAAPQGTIYSAISDWLNEAHQTDFPVVPLPVYMPETRDDLRAELGIPADAVVIGRYGGWAQFDIGFVQEAVVDAAQRDEHLFFAFMNTEPFSHAIPNIIHLPARIDAVEKRKFVNTCDAYLDGRRGGETFGLACGEFAICGRPVIGYARGRARAHVRILGDKMVRYRDKEELLKILTGFRRGRYPMAGNGYLDYLPEPVMETFDRTFIRSPNRRNY